MSSWMASRRFRVLCGLIVIAFGNVHVNQLLPFDTTTTTKEDLVGADKSNDPSHLAILDDINERWNIHSPHARFLMDRIWQNDNRYDPERDLIVFYHPLKSGGTSLSQVLDRLGGVVPGSKPSGYFQFEEFNETYQKEISSGNVSHEEWWSSRKVLYSHSNYRGYHRPETPLAALLHNHNHKSKQVRLITMIREPVELVASNFNEWFCGLGKWIKAAQKLKLPPSNASFCHGYTLEDLTEARILATEQECQNATISTLPGRAQQRCRAYSQGKADPMPYCASIPIFLASAQFKNTFQDMYGGYTLRRDDDTSSTVEEDYTEGALEYLGGVDTAIGEDDVLWFGITERMNEGMCLFHYQTGLPWVETPTERFRSCRPITYWADEDKAHFQSMQLLDYAVHRAANAIMDMRLYQMRVDLWTRITQHNVSLKSLPYTTAECLGQNPVRPLT